MAAASRNAAPAPSTWTASRHDPARCRSARWARRRSSRSRACPDGLSHPVQAAWLQHEVPQCGYCQSGQIMAAAALLKDKPNPTEADVDDAITNICRCGTYQRIRAAIHTVAPAAKAKGGGIIATDGTPSPFLSRHDAAAGGGLALGWPIPAASALSRWRSRGGHLGVIRPDDTTSPRRPLGNGPGHSDRPRPTRGRELDCDWPMSAPNMSRLTITWPTNAPGANVDRRQPRHRGSVDYVRKGGAAAARC